MWFHLSFHIGFVIFCCHLWSLLVCNVRFCWTLVIVGIRIFTVWLPVNAFMLLIIICNFCCFVLCRFQTAHIWACPPSEGDDYIFHCHPPEQKIPKPKRLQDWYRRMLDKAIADRVVCDYKVCIYVCCPTVMFCTPLSVHPFVRDYRVGQKKVSLRSLHITSSNTGRFSKFFHCHIPQEICNKVIIKYSTSPQTCRYTTLWNIYALSSSVKSISEAFY